MADIGVTVDNSDVVRLENAVKDARIELDRIERQSGVTSREFAKQQRELNRLRNLYASVSNSARRMANAQARAGVETQRATKKMSRSSVVTQQFGYQMSDFIVQVQSGQSAFIAFGQQATQLAGLLPPLAGLIVGVGVSLGTMVGQMIWATQKSKEAAAGMMTYRDALKSVQDQMAERRMDELIRTTGFVSEEDFKLFEEYQRLLFQAHDTEMEINRIKAEGNVIDRALLPILERNLRVQQERAEEAYENVRNARLLAREEENVGRWISKNEEAYQVYYNLLEEGKNQVGETTKKYEQLVKEIGEAAAKAILLSDVDIASGIDAATKSAALLAGELGVSLRAALAIASLSESQRMPRSVGSVDFNDPRTGMGGSRDTSGSAVEALRRGENPFRYNTNFSFPDIKTSSGGGGGSSPIKRQEEEITFLQEKMEEYKDAVLDVREALQDTFSDNLADLLTQNKSFGESMKAIYRGIVEELVRVFVFQNLIRTAQGGRGVMVGDLLGPVFGGKKLAKGGIINSPTMVAPNTIAGEAGPEAVLPLKRNSKGELGVAGGGVTINMTVNTPDVQGFRKSQGQIARQVSRSLATAQRNS